MTHRQIFECVDAHAQSCDLALRTVVEASLGGEAIRTWRGWALLVGSVLSTLGCSSDDRSPREQCLAYQDAYCAKAVECDVPSDRADQSEACSFFWQVYSSCDHVAGVTERLPLCMNALQSLSCASVPAGQFPEFPADCQGIFYGSP